MKFSNLGDQIIGDTIEAWLAQHDGASALKEFDKLTGESAASEAGLFWRYKIAVAQNDTDLAMRTLCKVVADFPHANWAVLILAVISAHNGSEEFAINLLKARHSPPLEDWTIALMMAHNVADKVPEHAVGYFATACNLCPDNQREFVVEHALDHPQLAKAIQRNNN